MGSWGCFPLQSWLELVSEASSTEQVLGHKPHPPLFEGNSLGGQLTSPLLPQVHLLGQNKLPWRQGLEKSPLTADGRTGWGEGCRGVSSGGGA